MAVTKKRLKTKNKINKEKILQKLNANQELFCHIYTQNTYLYGNGTLCYAQAYKIPLESLPTDDAIYSDPDTETGLREKIKDSSYQTAYDNCSAAASRLLRNAKVNDKIKELLVNSMTDSEVDSELIHTIKQREDYSAKMRAITEYNKIKQRITQKTDITTQGEKVSVIGGMEIILEQEKEDGNN